MTAEKPEPKPASFTRRVIAQYDYLWSGEVRVTEPEPEPADIEEAPDGIVAVTHQTVEVLTVGGGAYGHTATHYTTSSVGGAGGWKRGVVIVTRIDDRPPGIYWTRTSGKTHRVEVKR